MELKIGNFKYYAMMYLNDWYRWDKSFTERISSADLAISLAALNDAAKYYQVIRNFPNDGREKRLEDALSLLLSVSGPITEENVCEKVNSLASAFKEKYKNYAVSAASKFLWLRYKCPLVIFDSRAIAWLRANDYKVPYNGGYKGYRDQWLSAYADHEKQIHEACSGLVAVKGYSLAYDERAEDVVAIVTSRWFMERVFDKYLWFNAGGG